MQFIALHFRKYFENAFWLIFEKGFTLFAGLVVGIYVARYLQPVSFGMLNYAIGFVSIFSAFSTLGLDQILVRELARGPDRRDELLGTGFVLKLAGSGFLMALLLCILLFMDHDPFTNTLIMIIAGAELFKSLEVISYFYQSQVQSKYVVQTQLLVNLAVSFSKLMLVFVHAPLIWFAIVIMAGSMLNALGYVLTYRARTGTPGAWHFRRHLCLSLLRESWPLALYGVALYVQARIDQVMLGNMLSNYEVGQYSLALKFIEMFGFIPTVLLSTFMPAVSRGKAAGEDLYRSRLLNLYRLMFLMFLLVSVPIFFFAESIIVYLYGTEYQAAGYLLSLFALRLFFSNMGVGKSVFITNESLFKYSLVTVVIGAVASISFNYLFIPLYGTTGSVVASMISFTISIFLIDVFFAKPRKNLALMLQGIGSFWKLKNVQ